MDVYNVEAEAAGCPIAYYEGDDTSIPSPVPGQEVYHEDDSVESLKIPEPASDGRMPLMLEVARRVHRLLGEKVPIRGAVSAPFSLAANLAGAQNLFMLTVTRPDLVRALLSYAVHVIHRYSLAFIETGCDVIMFDSLASPQLLSPVAYRELVLPPTAELIRRLHRDGLKHVPLIIGGNTTKILDAYLETGGNNILCDAAADPAAFRMACSSAGRAFRRNISTTDFLTATPDELRTRAIAILEAARGYPGFIFGTGVVPFGTPLESLRALRETVEEFTPAH